MNDFSTLSYYFRNAKNSIPLSPEEELLLFEQLNAGDDTVKEKLWEANLFFIIKIARMYRQSGLTLGDFIQEGSLGLMYAIEKFNKDTRVRFLTYAAYWVRKYIQKALYEKSRVIRLPRETEEALKKIRAARSELFKILGRDPTSDEIADFLNVPEKQVANLLSLEDPLPIDGVARDKQGDERPLKELLADVDLKSPEDILIEEEQQQWIAFLLSHLSVRQREVIELYFGINQTEVFTMEEIAGQMKISSERVRQLKEAGLTRLKKIMLKDNY